MLNKHTKERIRCNRERRTRARDRATREIDRALRQMAKRTFNQAANRYVEMVVETDQALRGWACTCGMIAADTLGISEDRIKDNAPAFSTAEVMNRHYGFKKNAT